MGDPHPPRLRAEANGEGDLLADQRSKHRLDGLDGRVELEHLGVDDLPAAERQELRGEGRRPGRGHGDRLHLAERFVRVEVGAAIRGEVVRQQLGVSLDREQHVVEVVGDTAGQPPDRLQLLGLKKLVLGHLAGGDVDHGRDDPGTLGRVDRREADLHRELRAVLAATRQVHADPGRPGDRVGPEATAVPGVARDGGQWDQDLDRLAEQLAARIAERRFDPRVQVANSAGRVGCQDRIGRGVQDLERPAREGGG